MHEYKQTQPLTHTHKHMHHGAKASEALWCKCSRKHTKYRKTHRFLLCIESVFFFLICKAQIQSPYDKILDSTQSLVMYLLSSYALPLTLTSDSLWRDSVVKDLINHTQHFPKDTKFEACQMNTIRSPRSVLQC